MKFNFETFSKKENRRDFFKKLSLIGASLLFSQFTNSQNLEKKITLEDLCIEGREIWDKDWDKIKIQYEKKLGETFFIKEKNKTIEKQATIYSYLDSHNEKKNTLKEELKRIVIHHSAILSEQGPVDEVLGVKDFHIKKRGWSDIGYHYLITHDGQIFEGRPIDKVGAHAGSTFETKEDFKKEFGDNFKDLNPLNQDYLEKFNKFKNALKKDPDYGSIGICLLGDFNMTNELKNKQEESLRQLLDLLKIDFDIPKNNIIYHKEVDDLVVKPSGLKLSSQKTDCPGNKFLNKEKLLNSLREDTEEALCKNILLEY